MANEYGRKTLITNHRDMQIKTEMGCHSLQLASPY